MFKLATKYSNLESRQVDVSRLLDDSTIQLVYLSYEDQRGVNFPPITLTIHCELGQDIYDLTCPPHYGAKITLWEYYSISMTISTPKKPVHWFTTGLIGQKDLRPVPTTGVTNAPSVYYGCSPDRCRKNVQGEVAYFYAEDAINLLMDAYEGAVEIGAPIEQWILVDRFFDPAYRRTCPEMSKSNLLCSEIVDVCETHCRTARIDGVVYKLGCIQGTSKRIYSGKCKPSPPPPTPLPPLEPGETEQKICLSWRWKAASARAVISRCYSSGVVTRPAYMSPISIGGWTSRTCKTPSEWEAEGSPVYIGNSSCQSCNGYAEWTGTQVGFGYAVPVPTRQCLTPGQDEDDCYGQIYAPGGATWCATSASFRWTKEDGTLLMEHDPDLPSPPDLNPPPLPEPICPCGTGCQYEITGTVGVSIEAHWKVKITYIKRLPDGLTEERGFDHTITTKAEASMPIITKVVCGPDIPDFLVEGVSTIVSDVLTMGLDKITDSLLIAVMPVGGALIGNFVDTFFDVNTTKVCCNE